jgi:hypothetical protein
VQKQKEENRCLLITDRNQPVQMHALKRTEHMFVSLPSLPSLSSLSSLSLSLTLSLVVSLSLLLIVAFVPLATLSLVSMTFATLSLATSLLFWFR